MHGRRLALAVTRYAKFKRLCSGEAGGGMSILFFVHFAPFCGYISIDGFVKSQISTVLSFPT